jgi:hypothetical protein
VAIDHVNFRVREEKIGYIAYGPREEQIIRI